MASQYWDAGLASEKAANLDYGVQTCIFNDLAPV
jgi:hypothetical protein